MVSAVDQVKVIQSSDAEGSAIVTQAAVVINDFHILLFLRAAASGIETGLNMWKDVYINPKNSVVM